MAALRFDRVWAAERAVERRIEERQATRMEWLAYRRWLRLAYGPPRHGHAHRERDLEQALAALEFAVRSAATRAALRRLARPMLNMAMAVAYLREPMARAAHAMRLLSPPLRELEAWRIRLEYEAWLRQNRHFELEFADGSDG